MKCQCRAEEYHCAGMSILWGAWLLLPMRTFLIPSYALFAKLAPEWLWGAIFLTWGVAHLLSIRNGEYRSRRAFALAGVFKWVALMTLYLFSSQSGLGAAFSASFAIASFFNYLALGVREANGNGHAAETSTKV